MKAILIYDCNREKDEFTLAVNSGALWSVLWDLDQYLRSIIKHDRSKSEDYVQAIEDTRDKIHVLMTDHGISFEMVS